MGLGTPREGPPGGRAGGGAEGGILGARLGTGKRACPAPRAALCSFARSPVGTPTALDRPMKIRIRKSNTKKARQVGFRTRQKTRGGRKTNKRQRARHGAI